MAPTNPRVKTAFYLCFNEADDAFITDLDRASFLCDYSAGEDILRRGSDDRNVHILVSGSAYARLISAEGREIWLDEYEPGSLFGEMAALIEVPRSCDVVAREASVTARFSQEDILALMRQHPALGLRIARMLAQRVEATTLRMFAMGVDTVEVRLMRELLARSESAAIPGQRMIHPAPQITELAVRVGATREATSRAFNKLLRRGLLAREDGGVVLTYPELIPPA